jgi:hypothetical protein
MYYSDEQKATREAMIEDGTLAELVTKQIESQRELLTSVCHFDGPAMTADQAIAFAQFARELGDEYRISGNSIMRPKSRDEIEYDVVQSETWKRREKN